jgi:hypothetical protein
MTHLRTSRNRAAAEWFGDGSDGNATISGASTLAADKYYANLTIQAGAEITTTGYRIFVNGILDLTAAPTGSFITSGYNGRDASTWIGGGAPIPAIVAGTLPIGQTGLPGKTANTVAGIASDAQVSIISCGGQGARGGNGGDSVSFGGGDPAALNALTVDNSQEPVWLKLYYTAATRGGAGGQQGCTGAGVGGGNAGGSGAGGSGGNIMWICARTIKRGTNVNTGIFQAKGGNGGLGGDGDGANTGGGGGGAGGGGGSILIVCEALEGDTIADAVDVSGGNGGNGGNKNGAGTGEAGTGGGGGAKGATALLKANAGGFVYTAPGTPVAPIDETQAGRTGEAGLVDL